MSEQEQEQDVPKASNSENNNRVQTFGVYTGEQLLDNGIQKIPMLLESLFPQVGLIALGGSSDTGKSALLRQFACAVALGDPEFLGFRLNQRHFKAIYVSTEDDMIATSALLQKHKTQKP